MLKPAKVSCAALVLGLILLGPSPAPGQPVETEPPPQETEDSGQYALARMLTAINMPSRVVLCGFGGIMGGLLMAISAGRRYGEAVGMMEESCSGPWIITPEMIEEKRVVTREQKSVVWEFDDLETAGKKGRSR